MDSYCGRRIYLTLQYSRRYCEQVGLESGEAKPLQRYREVHGLGRDWYHEY